MTYDLNAGPGDPFGFDDGAQSATSSPSNALAKSANFLAAAISLGLIFGLCLWGYRLYVRDVSGIPIVQAVQGEMRVRPNYPGGLTASHQGLAVNAVTKDGGAADPEDRIVLAPQPVELTEEDMPLDDEAVAMVQQAIEDQAAAQAARDAQQSEAERAASVAAAAESGSVENMVAALTSGLVPLDAPDPTEQQTVIAQLSNPATTTLSEIGLTSSIRPRLRPQTQPGSSAASAVSRGEVDPAQLPSGTRLVQLGAYDSPDIARQEWQRFTGRFADLMQSKDLVVQRATSGGRIFYRLRAHGFEDLSDARRFCSALLAEGADCIPVVTR